MSLKYTVNTDIIKPIPNENRKIYIRGNGNNSIVGVTFEPVTKMTSTIAMRENINVTNEEITLDIGKIYLGI